MRSVLVPILKQLVFILGFWRPTIRQLEEVVDRFAAVNGRHWEPIPCGTDRILIEGHLSEYGPNYLFRTGLAARAVLSVLGSGKAEVVVNGFSYNWQTARKAYCSFGITGWVFLGQKYLFLGPVLYFFAWLGATLSFLRIRSSEQLLELNLGGIKVGDLIYDEVLRVTKQPTIEAVNRTVHKVMVRSWYYYYQYRVLFSLRKYRYYIATHTAYPEYGLLCRVALQRGVTVIETSDIQMSVYRTIGERNLPTYHQGINAEILAELSSGLVPGVTRETRARDSLRRRLEAEIKQIDAQKAYSGRVYTRSDLCVTLGVGSDRRIGFILAHVFCDSPHLSSSMLYADYYRWLVSTIDCCAEAKDVVWIVKPHPSCALYGEEGMVEALVQDKGAENVWICPKDLNTCSLANCADVILTVHGTAGLEYSCLGIPTILAGTPFYAGFGFAHEPQTVVEYNSLILQTASLPRLSQEQMSTALQVFATWEDQFDWNNRIVTTEVLANVWGNGVSRDLQRAYELLTDNLEATNPKELKLWDFACSVARDDAESHD